MLGYDMPGTLMSCLRRHSTFASNILIMLLAVSGCAWNCGFLVVHHGHVGPQRRQVLFCGLWIFLVSKFALVLSMVDWVVNSQHTRRCVPTTSCSSTKRGLSILVSLIATGNDGQSPSQGLEGCDDGLPHVFCYTFTVMVDDFLGDVALHKSPAVTGCLPLRDGEVRPLFTDRGAYYRSW